MNKSETLSFPIASNADFDAYTRAKLNSSGQLVHAGAGDKAIGVFEEDVLGSNGRLVASIYMIGRGGSHFAKANAAIAVGQRFVGAADGEIAPVSNGVVTDLDAAASTGTAVKVAANTDGVTAFLNSTNAGNADSVAALWSGGPIVNIDDNDSPAGVVLYFDEDATDSCKRFLCVSPTGKDLLVPVSNGMFLRVAHDASAASNGVAVYFDDDAASTHARLMWVSPTNTAGAFELDRITDTISEGIALEAFGADHDIKRVFYF